MEFNEIHEGILSGLIWPTFAGSENLNGEEPLDDFLYSRGQINWYIDAETQTIMGRTNILVPKGYFTHIVYAHHPQSRLICGRQVLSHPFDFKVDGVIGLDRITQEDFQQFIVYNKTIRFGLG